MLEIEEGDTPMPITEEEFAAVANVADASSLLLKALLLVLNEKVSFKQEMHSALDAIVSSESYSSAIIERVRSWIDDLDKVVDI
jgi:hypothetical protein